MFIADCRSLLAGHISQRFVRRLRPFVVVDIPSISYHLLVRRRESVALVNTLVIFFEGR